MRKISQDVWASLFVFLWPFLYFFRFVVPIDGRYTGIGNDFLPVYYYHKPYLLYHLSRGQFPLWSPSEAIGFPFYSSPIAQALYPLNLPLAVFYRLAGGFSDLDYQRYTILGVAIFALGLFLWLRRLGFGLRPALLAVMIFSVSYKVAETMRFPNTIHTLAWFPWVLLFSEEILRRPAARRMWASVVALVLCWVCILTAGYPYFIVYFAFLYGPYLLLWLWPAARRTLFDAAPRAIWRELGLIAGAVLVAALICLPYLIKVYQLLEQVLNRSSATAITLDPFDFELDDTLGSLVFPPAAQAEGWYFFSTLVVLLFAFYLLYALLVRRSSALSGDRPPLAGPLILLGWALLITFLSWGKDDLLAPLYGLPLLERLRAWGRVNILQVIVLAWLLAWVYTWLETWLARRPLTARQRWFAPGLLATLYAAVLAIQLSLWRPAAYDHYWRRYFAQWEGSEGRFVWAAAISFVILLMLLVWRGRGQWHSRYAGWGSAVLLLIAAVLEMNVSCNGAWTYNAIAEPRQRLNLDRMDLRSFDTPRANCYTLSLTNSYCTRNMANWGFDRYYSFRITQNEFGSDKVNRLLGMLNGQKLYFSEQLEAATVDDFFQDANRFENFARVISYNGDRLELEVQAPRRGYLSFIDNWDPDWQAEVDGQPVEIALLFGTFKAVALEPGAHQVIFTYRPRLGPWTLNARQ